MENIDDVIKSINSNRDKFVAQETSRIRNNNLNGKKVKEVKEISGKKVLFYAALATTILAAAFVSKKISDKKATNYDHTVTDYSTGSTTYYNDGDYKPNR